MKLFKLCTLFMVLSLSPALASEWVPILPDQPAGSAPEINVLESNALETRIEIVLPGFYIENTPEGQAITVPGWPMTLEVGKPHLPCSGMILALPDGKPVSIELVESDSTLYRNVFVRPTPVPTVDGQEPPPLKAVPWQGAYPGAVGRSMTPGYIGELPVSTVKAYPFQCEAATGLLNVCSRMVLAVHHGTPSWPQVALTDQQARVCSSTVINFPAVPHVPLASKNRSQPNYIVIADSGVTAGVQPLVEWRATTGFHTEVRTVNSPSQQTVKNIILEYPSVEYVLLVGDEDEIPLASFGGTYGDHWYACTTGGSNPDIYADLGIGRLSGSTVSRIEHQVNKILDYEKNPPLGLWLKTTIFVAHRENYPYKYTGCKEDIAGNMASWSDWSVQKIYGGAGGEITNNTVKSAVNAGVHIVNYRGHGDDQEWWSWNLQGESFYNSDVAALTNGDKRPIVFNIACNNSNIRGDCFSEEWLDIAGGATAALGAVEPSYTYPNHDFDKALYECIFNLGITDISSMLAHANNEAIALHGSLGEKNAKMYLWCGDPAMNIWLDIPGTDMTATHSATTGTGSQDFAFYVEAGGSALEGATVSAYKDGEVYATGVTGSDGNALLPMAPATTGTMYVSATHPEFLPYEGTVAVQEAGNPVPDIKVNGDDGPLTVQTSDDVTVSVHLDPGNLDGDPADWWIYVERDDGDEWWAKYRSGLSPKWTKTAAPLRFAGATLRVVNGYTVLGPRTFPVGTFNWFFAVDDKNGLFEGTYSDTMALTVVN